MNNYDKMLADAQHRVTTYELTALAQSYGVQDMGAHLQTAFFAETVRLEKATGLVMVGERPGDFGETLSVLDWLCDRKPYAAPSYEFCAVGSLPGVYVGGSGLVMNSSALAMKIHNDPQNFRRACEILVAKPVPMGDLGYQVQIFPDLPMCLKFYFGDEEFPPQLIFLWDRNTLQFVRYETVYYIAGCLQKRLRGLMDVYSAQQGSI